MESAPEIWLVDDLDSEHELMRLAFEQAKVTLSIRGFFNAEDAVEALSQGDRPKLILLDLNMPGLGPNHLFGHRSEADFAPIIILSSSANPDDIRRAYENGAAAYVEKPAGMVELIAFAEKLNAFWFDGAILPGAA